MALVHPLQFSTGSLVPQPFASPVYGTVATHCGAAPSLKNVHQSIALMYSRPVCGLNAAPFHCTPATRHRRPPQCWVLDLALPENFPGLGIERVEESILRPAHHTPGGDRDAFV